ncbi:DUF6232 family protein [Streptomyces sp. NPDC052496]|uniref:DUF6232 family protein n=1 Tax=Streptomyces sp. NPDC052496 TaxID=3154951 RepID=UPI00342352BC
MINVEVSRRTLWVGSAAYPLHNIACVTTTEVKPRFSVVMKRARPWMLGSFAVLMALSVGAGGGGTTGVSVSSVFLAVLLMLLASGLIWLFTALPRRELHRLDIETAGAPYAILTSPDKNLVAHIARSVMDAIDNPQTEFQFQVENFHVGDSIKQFGNHNTAKVTR